MTRSGTGLWPVLTVLLLLPASPSPGATWYVTVAGLGGEPDYEKRFQGQAQDLDKLCSKGGTSVTLYGSKATRENLKAELAKIAAAAKADDLVVLTLIGHGTFDGTDYKFTVPGPDISANDLASWLDPIAARQVIVDTTSSSGAIIEVLRRPNRVLITATRSGNQRNLTVFARYWVEALRDAAADLDKNGAVSALEAFRYADQKTARFYETNKRLASEQALLEDTGKGNGVRNPGPDNGQGLLAAKTVLIRTSAAEALYSDPEKRKLLDRKTEIEASIDQLKYEKAAIPLDEYKKRLQLLLIELATIQEALEK